LLCPLPPRDPLNRPPIESNVARVRRPESRQSFKQGSFANPITPQHTPDLTGREFKIEALADPGTADLNTEILQHDRHQ
jgi:hypothetical protein